MPAKRMGENPPLAQHLTLRRHLKLHMLKAIMNDRLETLVSAPLSTQAVSNGFPELERCPISKLMWGRSPSSATGRLGRH